MQKRPHMTIYPLEFHRRTEQRWARRAQLSRASETLDVECPCSVPPGPPLLSRNASADAGAQTQDRSEPPRPGSQPIEPTATVVDAAQGHSHRPIKAHQTNLQRSLIVELSTDPRVLVSCFGCAVGNVLKGRQDFVPKADLSDCHTDEYGGRSAFSF